MTARRRPTWTQATPRDFDISPSRSGTRHRAARVSAQYAAARVAHAVRATIGASRITLRLGGQASGGARLRLRATGGRAGTGVSAGGTKPMTGATRRGVQTSVG